MKPMGICLQTSFNCDYFVSNEYWILTAESQDDIRIFTLFVIIIHSCLLLTSHIILYSRISFFI